MSISVTLYILDAHATSEDLVLYKQLIKEHRWTEVIPQLEAQLTLPSSTNAIREDLALSYLRTNNRSKAYQVLIDGKLFKQAGVASVSYNTEEGLRLYEEAFILLNQNKLKQSLDKLEKAILLEKDHLDILTRILECKLLLNDASDALKTLTRINELYGFKDESAYLKSVFELKFTEKPIDNSTLTTLTKTDSISISLLRVEFYRKFAKKNEALVELKKVSDKYPALSLLSAFEILLRSEFIKDEGEKPLLLKSLTDHLTAIEKTPELYTLNLSEWGRRLYAPELIKIQLKTAFDNLNRQTN